MIAIAAWRGTSPTSAVRNVGRYARPGVVGEDGVRRLLDVSELDERRHAAGHRDRERLKHARAISGIRLRQSGGALESLAGELHVPALGNDLRSCVMRRRSSAP
jgi:hypothetical protein